MEGCSDLVLRFTFGILTSLGETGGEMPHITHYVLR